MLGNTEQVYRLVSGLHAPMEAPDNLLSLRSFAPAE